MRVYKDIITIFFQMRHSHRRLFLFTFLLFVIFLSTFSLEEETKNDEASSRKIESEEVKKKGGRKKWNKIDFKKIEEEWEDGDDPEELENEHDELMRVQQRVQRGVQLDPRNPKKFVKSMKTNPFSGMDSKTGGSMIFVEINPKKAGGGTYSPADIEKLTAKWSGLVRTASLEAKFYFLGQDGNKKNAHSLLANVDKGWMVSGIMKFLLTQKETARVTLDSKDYLPKDFAYLIDDDDDDL
jgi:hypothetical protein